MRSLSQILAVHFLAVIGLACVWPPRMSFGEEATQGSELPNDYSCIVCHRRGGLLWTESTPLADEDSLANDIHWQAGLRCHDCHGGSPTLDAFRNHRDDPTFRSASSPDQVPAFCGHCHSDIDFMRQYNPSARTDQEEEYWTSGHGRRLKASAERENPELDQEVATCIDCHGGHGILAVNDSHSRVYPNQVAATCARCHSNQDIMRGRSYDGQPLGHDQFDQWKQSVHGRAMLEKGDLSAATCNDCHGNHGALPPGVNSVANACGTCHGKIAKLFADTQMNHKFEEIGLPGCVTCHGKHDISKPTDESLGIDDRTVCIRCHNPQNPQYGATLAGAEVAKKMRSGLDQLKDDITHAEATIQKAEQLGMQVRGPRFNLRQAFDELTNARTLVHSFSQAPIEEALSNGLTVTSAVQAAADGALREHTNRRIWLACSLVPILIVIGLLLYYIRSLPTSTTSDV